jgi:hypothetical protein
MSVRGGCAYIGILGRPILGSGESGQVQWQAGFEVVARSQNLSW